MCVSSYNHTRTNDENVLIPSRCRHLGLGINFGEPTSFASAIFGLTPKGTGAGPLVVSSKPNVALGVSGGTEASIDQQAKLDALKVRSHNVVHAVTVCPPIALLQRRSSRMLSRTTGAELSSLLQTCARNPCGAQAALSQPRAFRKLSRISAEEDRGARVVGA